MKLPLLTSSIETHFSMSFKPHFHATGFVANFLQRVPCCKFTVADAANSPAAAPAAFPNPVGKGKYMGLGSRPLITSEQS